MLIPIQCLKTWLALPMLFLVLIGCAVFQTTNLQITKFDDSQFSPIADKIMGLDKVQCNELKGKKIFTNFTISFNQDKDYFLESFNFVQVSSPNRGINKISYRGKINIDIKRKLDEVLNKYCGTRNVEAIEEADIVIISDIEKFYSQIIDYKSSLNPRSIKQHTSSILTINNKINVLKDEWKYDHLISLRRDRFSESKGRGEFSFVYLDTMRFLVNYDDEITIATGACTYTSSQNDNPMAMPVNIWFAMLTGTLLISFESKEVLNIFDVDSMENIKQITVENKSKVKSAFSSSDVSLDKSRDEYYNNTVSWWGIPNDKTEKEYVMVYATTSGHLKYLIYDYIKELIYKINTKVKS